MKEEELVSFDQKLASLIVEPAPAVPNRQQWRHSFSRKITGSVYYRFAGAYGIIALITCLSIISPLVGPQWETVGHFSSGTQNTVVTDFFELGSETRITVSIETGELSSTIGGMISVFLIPEEGNPVPEIAETLHLKNQVPHSSSSQPWVITGLGPGTYKLCIVTFDLEKWEVTVTTYI